MKDIKIKDVSLVSEVTGNEKIPVSNGSGKPAAVTIKQILDKVDLSDYATNESLENKADKSDIPDVSKFVTNTALVSLLSISKFEFVDLGLPSGLLWATCNVGANSPEEYGLYFAWGETEGFTTDDVTNGVRTFNLEEYKWCNGTYSSLTKYNTSSNYGTVDNKIQLELEDDVVYNNDNSCRLPTYKDLKELKDNTTLTWESLNGVRGARLTGTNGNSIFIPAAGSFSSESGDGGANPGYTGYIVASTTQGNGTPKYPSRAWSYMVQSTYSSMSYIPRFKGVPLRAVQDADADRKLFNPNKYYTKEEVDALLPSENNNLELPVFEVSYNGSGMDLTEEQAQYIWDNRDTIVFKYTDNDGCVVVKPMTVVYGPESEEAGGFISFWLIHEGTITRWVLCDESSREVPYLQFSGPA